MSTTAIESSLSEDMTQTGIIPRAIKDIFHRIIDKSKGMNVTKHPRCLYITA
jgi:hypothetical protein